ncbi:MAG: type II secretion system F family protein [Actinobacteria bacterium]|nr:type II secretion system F family protein [Actinomycetota bacterium]
MSRWLVVAALALWAGLTILFAELRWFRRPSLAERVRPYTPGGLGHERRAGAFSVVSIRDVIGPLASTFGDRVARLFGVSETLAVRLERIHSPLSVQAFRTRQIGWSVASFAIVSLSALVLGVPPALAVLFVMAAPLLAFLLLEQQIGNESRRWQRRIFLELPVVSEQLGMLLSAGYSLGSGLQRLATRGSGACAGDLRRVCGRMRQGLSEIDALREWAELADVDALRRLAAVLALNREAGDLGNLITEEARSIRRDAQRELIAAVEKRSQQVWIPVTVATLLPGVIFLAVPFVAAINMFTNN